MPDEAQPPLAPAATMPGANRIPGGPTAPATMAPQSTGLQARVPMLVELALKPLREAAKLIDPTTPQGDILHKAMMMLAKEFGKPSEDLSRAEVKLLGERAGGVSPANPAAFQKAMQQQAQQKVGPSPTPAPAGV